jgi:hypothetical protein
MDVLVLMHNDAPSPETASWDGYIEKLVVEGVLRGGSSLRALTQVRRQGDLGNPTGLVGFLRLNCRDLAHVEALLAENPAYLAGATIEVCEEVEEG